MNARCESCECEVGMADMPIPPDKEARNDANEVMILCEACRMKRKKSFRFIGMEAIESTPRASGNGAVVYVPRKWIGCRVAVVRLDEGIRDLENRAHEECSREGTTRPETIKELRHLRRVRDGMV